MTDSESLLDTLACLEQKENGAELINVLNVIANLLRELDNRRSKATYTRKFKLGKLVVDVAFDGMK